MDAPPQSPDCRDFRDAAARRHVYYQEEAAYSCRISLKFSMLPEFSPANGPMSQRRDERN
jgi:hypothetical protein